MDHAANDHLVAAVSLVLAGLFLLGVVRLRRAPPRLLCGVLIVIALLSAGWFFWYAHRPVPTTARTRLFQGIDYIREVRSTPRALVIHVVTVDLDAPGIRFFVTPGGEDIPAQTVSEFLAQYDLQVAINVDFFLPWHDVLPWDYYPHEGDPVNTRGLAASEGKVFTQGFTTPDDYATLYISADNQVSFGVPNGDIYNAVSGLLYLLVQGEAQVKPDDSALYSTDLHPRTAVGLDETGRTLIIMIVDGRQPNYSEGVSFPEQAELLREYGAYNAISLDGGGSSTLVVQGYNGLPNVLNSPIHSHIPGRERPVANQLGIYAER